MKRTEENNEHTQKAAQTSHKETARSAPGADLFRQVTERDKLDGEAIQRPSVSYWQDAWHRLKKNRLAIASGIFILLLATSALVIPSFLPYNHVDPEDWNRNLPPSLGQEATVVNQDADWYQVVTLPETAGEVGADGDAYEMSEEAPATPQPPRLLGSGTIKGIAITWDPVPGAEGYRVYRSITPDFEGVPQGDVEYNVLSYLDTLDLTANKKYYYRVVAFNMFEDSAFSEPLEIEAKLALSLEQAQFFDPNVEVGATITTFPHYLGTDDLGRDILARCLFGAKISLFIGFVAPLCYMIIGVLFGAISGFIGGLVDDVMMRVADTVSTVPELLSVIMLQVFLGSGIHTLLIAMVLVGWARSARQIRGEVLKLREMEFVYASQVLGTSFRKIILRHLVPNVSGTILVLFTLAIPSAIFTEAFLSFIGLGIAPPDASWGTITVDGAKVFLTYPHQLLAPATMICMTIFAFNMFGDGLRDALDPKLRGAK